jgi:universal stress protein A
MKTIKKVLVATDFSEFSAAAMEYAKMFAARFKAKVYLVHVVDIAPLIGPGGGPSTFTISHEVEQDATIEMRRFAAKHFGRMKNLELIIGQGDPRQEIVKLVEKEKIDLIVMATHGRTGLAHVILGSVAERVVQNSPVPVVMVRPAQMVKSQR